MQSFSIYLVISSTSTKLGHAIQRITHYPYNHISISLHSNLSPMYSFSRYAYNNPLVGGFVEESPNRYRHLSDHVMIKVFQIPVSQKSYDKIDHYLKHMNLHANRYLYNSISALLHATHKSRHINNAYTCIEFICHILNVGNVELVSQTKKITSIQQLDQQLQQYCIYKGKVANYDTVNDWGNDHYLEKKTPLYICSSTTHHFLRLLYRMIVSS